MPINIPSFIIGYHGCGKDLFLKFLHKVVQAA